jgi:hypothetical protein
MPLGKQFRNTYWEDENGNTRYALDKGGDRPEYTSSSAEVEKPTQGMLFDPYTGTGYKEDPSVHPIQRQAIASNALGWPEDDRLSQSLADSGIPIQTMRKINTSAKVSPIPSMYGNAAQYSPDDNELLLDSNQAMSSPDTIGAALTHEIGHHLDRSVHKTTEGRLRFLDPVYTDMWDDPDTPSKLPEGPTPDWDSEYTGGADPVEEGKADAFMDRSHTFSDVYEHKMPEVVARNMSEPFSDRGYGVNARSWKRKKNHDHTDTNRALYAATRILASKGDSAGSDLPNRSEVLNNTYGSRYSTLTDMPEPYDFPHGFDDSGYKKATEEALQGAQHTNNKTLLGHYVSRNPGLITSLHNINPLLGDAAREAHAHYKSIEPDNQTTLKRQREEAKAARGEQLKLEGI